MAITTVFLTGFEHGFLAAAAGAGTGLFGANPTSGWSASTTTPRNGSYCAHLVAPTNSQQRIAQSGSGGVKTITRFAVRVTARPSSGTAMIAHGQDGIGSMAMSLLVSSTGQLSVRLGISGTLQTGPTIDTSSWYVIELQSDGTGDTLDWKVDGVSQTQATASIADVVTVYLGTQSGSQPGFTADYDDWIVGTWTNAVTDWYGDGKVLAQHAGSDGTHSVSNHFSPGDAATAYASSGITTAYTMVDDAAGTGGWSATRSTTDNLAMRTANTASYMEIAPATTAESGVANAVRALLSYSSPTATANLAACVARNSAGAVLALWGTVGGTGADFSESTNFFKGGIVTVPAGTWTASEVNAVRWRFGGCTSSDINPVPTVQALMLEVDWPVTAVAEVIPEVVMAPGLAV